MNALQQTSDITSLEQLALITKIRAELSHETVKKDDYDKVLAETNLLQCLYYMLQTSDYEEEHQHMKMNASWVLLNIVVFVEGDQVREIIDPKYGVLSHFSLYL